MSEERWKPESGERYYCIDALGNVIWYLWGDITDTFYYKVGNCFRTEEEAQHVSILFKKLLQENTLRNKSVCSQLPKLTSDVFNRPDCPKWARYAAVDKSGLVRLFSHSPWLSESCWNWANGEVTQLFGVAFDASDWQNSLIERPVKVLPDWCKVGEWVYYFDEVDGYSYQKIDKIDNKYIYFYRKFDRSKPSDIFVSDRVVYSVFIENTEQARIRPWTFEEAPVVLKVKDPHGVALAYLSPFGGKFVIAYHHLDEYEKLKLGEVTFTFSAFADIFTQLDGSPCGVLEHLENGEWVK